MRLAHIGLLIALVAVPSALADSAVDMLDLSLVGRACGIAASFQQPLGLFQRAGRCDFPDHRLSPVSMHAGNGSSLVLVVEATGLA